MLKLLFHYGYSVPGFVILRVLPEKKSTIGKVDYERTDIQTDDNCIYTVTFLLRLVKIEQ